MLKAEQSMVVMRITRCCWKLLGQRLYADVNFVTALVPSDTACLASSPGRMSLTAV